MKCMKKFLILAVTVLVSVSCFNKIHKDESYVSEFAGMMTTINTATQASYEDAAMIRIIQQKLTLPEVDIDLNNVKFVAMMPDVNMTLKNLAFSIYTSDDENDPLLGYYKISYKSVVPYVGEVPREDYTMHNFTAYIGDRTINIDFDVNFGGQIYHAAFRLDENDEKPAYWSKNYKVEAQTTGGMAPFVDEATIEVEQLLASSTLLTMNLNSIRFNPMMPDVNFTLINVPFYTKDELTTRFVDVETIIPIDGNGNPMASYAMDNVKGQFDDGMMSLSFDMEMGGMTYKVMLGSVKMDM